MRRPVTGFEGYYEVSDDGVVYRIARGKGGIVGPLKPYQLRNGYLTVYPSRYDDRKRISVHHIVAEAFLGHRGSREVNHKNGVKTDNRIENLEYVTRQENATHAANAGLMPHGQRQWKARLNDIAVRQIRLMRSLGMRQRDIAQAFGVSTGTVNDVLRGVTWKHVVEVPI